ncbi:MAG: LD-carboxypeptidase [Phycisphaerae bacterium]
MERPKIHIIAPAGSCRPFLEAIEVRCASDLIDTVQEAFGSTYVVTGNEALIEAAEEEHRGGRQDDTLRAADIQQALADNHVVAVVLIRGGAWFTRVLPIIDFSVLSARSSRVAVFGFSELTTLVNIVGSYDQGIGVYDMGPAFLTYGLKRHVRQRTAGGPGAGDADKNWAQARLLPELCTFLRDVAAMIEGRGTSRAVTAELVAGSLGDQCQITVVGGNLTVASTLIGSRYARWFGPEGRWLLIEDFNETPQRIDRLLAHLTVAGLWERCAGVLLGDFHKGYEDLTPAVISMLDHHLPPRHALPILTTDCVGHVWPMSPLPLHLPLTLEHSGGNRYTITWPPSALKTVPLSVQT